MPPKVKITQQDIVQAAIALVRTGGAVALNARAVATALGCSTQPIFSNFRTMEELQEATIAAAYELYLSFIKREVESAVYPPYKAMGMAYVRFAAEEKELFKLLFMRDRTGEDLSAGPDFEQSVQMICKAGGLSEERARLLHLETWSAVHGIGVMLATSFLPLTEAQISAMLSDVYLALRARHKEEGK